MGVSDVTLTSDITRDGGAEITRALAGVTIAAGQVVYLDPADNRLKLAIGNSSEIIANVKGIALNGAAVDQPVELLTSGPATVTIAKAVGTPLFLSDTTAGALMEAADFGAGDRVVYVATVDAANHIKVKVHNPAVQHA